MPLPNLSAAELRQLLASLELLRPHGWHDHDFVLKPPFPPASIAMPEGWVWGESTLGDALDALEAVEAMSNQGTLMLSEIQHVRPVRANHNSSL